MITKRRANSAGAHALLMEKLAARREVMNMQRGFTKIRRTDLVRLAR